MNTAVIGTGGIGSAIARRLASGGSPCGSRAPTMSQREGWQQRSVEVRSSLRTIETLYSPPES